MFSKVPCSFAWILRCLAFFIGSLLFFNTLGNAQDTTQSRKVSKHFAPLEWYAHANISSARRYKKRISVSLNNVSLERALGKIAVKSNVRLSYDKLQLPKKMVSLSLHQKTVIEVFRNVLKGTGLEVLASPNGQLVVRRKVEAKEAAQIMQQTGSLSGTVTDAQTGKPLPGTNVVIKGLEKGTSTDTTGSYTISNVEIGTYTLIATFVGYRKYSSRVKIDEGNNVENIAMKPSALGLNELVVTGIGTQRRSNLTQSISTVKANKINNVGVSSTDELLQGRAAGVRVTKSSGTPGSAVNIHIRGSSSITAGSNPLYVIDGIPVSNGNLSAFYVGGQSLNALSTLSPQNIKSINILKGPSAKAIYGARGTNGVVLITTKEGKAGSTKINATYSTGISKFQNKLGFTKGPQFIKDIVDGLWLDFRRKGYASSLSSSYKNTNYQTKLQEVRKVFPAYFGKTFNNYVPEYISSFLDQPSSAPTTNWQDAVFKRGTSNRFNLSASGGNDQTQFYIAGNYYKGNAIMLNSGFKRMNGRLNLNHQVNNNLRFRARLSYNHDENNRVENDNDLSGLITDAFFSSPTATIYNKDGTFNFNTGSFSNPVAESKTTDNAITNRFLGSIVANYDLLDNLTLKAVAGIDRIDLNEIRYYPDFTTAGSPSGSATDAMTTDQRWNSKISIAYKNTFNNMHTLNAKALVTWEENDVNVSQAQGTIFPSNQTKTISSAAVTNGNSTATSFGLRSYIGRVNYDFNNRYIITINGRVDESSRFGTGNRAAFFPAASVAWRISEEKFMENIEFLSQLKLRASAGITGNQNGIGNFASRALYGIGNFNSKPSFKPAQLANTNLKWEKTTEYDIGLDVNFFNERLNLTTDIYKRNTNGLLLSAPIPATTGFTTYTANIGSLTNKGFELSINTVNVKSDDFRWSTKLDLSTNKNKVTKLVNNQPFGSNYANRVQVGQPLGIFYGYKTDGIWNTQEEINNSGIDPADADLGGIRYVDINGDGKITSADRTIIGNANPNWIGGLGNSFEYKGLALDVFFSFSLGNDINNSTLNYISNAGSQSFRLVRADYGNDFWTPANKNVDHPRPSFLNLDNNLSRTNSSVIEDGSYIRLKSFQFSYAFNAKQLNHIGIRSLKLFVTGTNLLTITRYSGLDPEVNTYDPGGSASFGNDFFTYPQYRSFEFGISLGL